ncbi:MAG: protein jag [Oscillospiraceae bacterium]|nr:protein jag [Oscillospiraceae bacterium]
MEKFHEAAGRTIDEAIQHALDKLGLDRDSVSVEVLEKPKAGFLGLGGTSARVRVSYEGEDGQAPAASPAPAAGPVKKPKPAEQAPPASGSAAPPAPAVPQGPRDARATAFLEGMLERMDAPSAVSLHVTEEGHLEYTLDGPKAGLLIGRRGETLDALQHLTGSVANRGEESSVRVTLDVGGYRVRREASLVEMAKNNAARAVRYRRNVVLEPMNSYARHVVHTALQDYPGVSTHSVGADPNRRVVISVPGGERGEREDRRPYKNGGGNRW